MENQIKEVCSWRPLSEMICTPWGSQSVWGGCRYCWEFRRSAFFGHANLPVTSTSLFCRWVLVFPSFRTYFEFILRPIILASRAPITKYHKPGGLEQQKFIVLQFCRLEIIINVSQDHVHPEDCRHDLFLPLPASGSPTCSWLTV